MFQHNDIFLPTYFSIIIEVSLNETMLVHVMFYNVATYYLPWYYIMYNTK